MPKYKIVMIDTDLFTKLQDALGFLSAEQLIVIPFGALRERDLAEFGYWAGVDVRAKEVEA